MNQMPAPVPPQSNATQQVIANTVRQVNATHQEASLDPKLINQLCLFINDRLGKMNLKQGCNGCLLKSQVREAHQQNKEILARISRLDQLFKSSFDSKKRLREEKLEREGKRPCFQREEISMENPEHHLLFLDKLYKERNETFDVVINLGKENIKAHYWILNQVPFFANLLQENSQKVVREGRDVTCINLESSFSPNIFEDFLFFLYLHRLPTQEIAITCNLLEMAINCKIKELEEYAFESLKKQLDVQTAFTIGNWAFTKDYLPLIGIAVDFVLQNIKECLLKILPELKIEEKLITKQFLMRVLSADYIELSESQIAEVVVNWLNQKNTRLVNKKDEITTNLKLSNHILSVRDVVRLGLISRNELWEKWANVSIGGIPLFSEKMIHESCKKEVQNITPKRNVIL